MHAHLLDLADLLADRVEVLLVRVQLVPHRAPLGIQRNDLIHERNIREPAALGLADELGVTALVCVRMRGIAARQSKQGRVRRCGADAHLLGRG